MKKIIKESYEIYQIKDIDRDFDLGRENNRWDYTSITHNKLYTYPMFPIKPHAKPSDRKPIKIEAEITLKFYTGVYGHQKNYQTIKTDNLNDYIFVSREGFMKLVTEDEYKAMPESKGEK